MEGISGSVLAFLAAVGIAALVWLLAGLVLRGRREEIPATLVLPACGGGEALEGWLHALHETRTLLGRSAGIAIVDCGLTAEGRRRAELLAARYEKTKLLTPAELGQIVE